MTKLLAALALSSSLVGCTDDPAPQPDALALPGSAYYPESLTADTHGTLYVGSLTTGQVVAFDDGKPDPHTVIPTGTDVLGETGVLIHDDELWLCSIDTTFQHPTQIRSFGLDGTPHATYTLGATQFCNDLVFDGDTLYATDSFSGNVLRVANGQLESFVQDPRFVPATQGAFGLDGIVADGHGALYVNKLDTGNLFRIDTQTKAITEIAVTPALAGPDGMRLVDDHTLLVIEGQASRLSRVTITGTTATSTALASDLDQPTGVVVARGSAWVSEGQLGRLFAQPAQAPNLPFAVRRVALEPFAASRSSRAARRSTRRQALRDAPAAARTARRCRARTRPSCGRGWPRRRRIRSRRTPAPGRRRCGSRARPSTATVPTRARRRARP
jgi:streptogramin lyase